VKYGRCICIIGKSSAVFIGSFMLYITSRSVVIWEVRWSSLCVISSVGVEKVHYVLLVKNIVHLGWDEMCKYVVVGIVSGGSNES
jgi:hypothetical protein